MPQVAQSTRPANTNVATTTCTNHQLKHGDLCVITSLQTFHFHLCSKFPILHYITKWEWLFDALCLWELFDLGLLCVVRSPFVAFKWILSFDSRIYTFDSCTSKSTVSYRMQPCYLNACAVNHMPARQYPTINSLSSMQRLFVQIWRETVVGLCVTGK